MPSCLGRMGRLMPSVVWILSSGTRRRHLKAGVLNMLGPCGSSQRSQKKLCTGWIGLRILEPLRHTSWHLEERQNFVLWDLLRCKELQCASDPVSHILQRGTPTRNSSTCRPIIEAAKISSPNCVLLMLSCSRRRRWLKQSSITLTPSWEHRDANKSNLI